MKYTILIIMVFLWAGCDDSDTTGADACNDVDCGDHGICAVVTNTPRCVCDTGYVESELKCVQADDAPRFTSVPKGSVHEGDTYTYEIACTDPQGGSLTLTTGDSHTCGGAISDNGDGTGSFSFTADETDGGGSCMVHIQCSDTNAVVSQMAQVDIIERNLSPEITNLPADLSTHWNESGHFEATATDSDDPGQTLTYSILYENCDGFDPLITTDGEISWACDGVEMCTLEVQVSDGISQSTGILNITCTDSPPSIDTLPATAAYELVTYTYEITCSDTDGDTLTITTGPLDTCDGTVIPTGNGAAIYRFTPADDAAGSSCVLDVACSDTQQDMGQSVEIHIHQTPGTWTTGGALNPPRYAHTATLLPNGKVLVLGGEATDAPERYAHSVAYNPISDAWEYNGEMSYERSSHTATLLSSGKVLVAGGGLNPNTAEKYNPTTNVWSAAGSMQIGREDHIATLLNDGRVLVTGGYGASELASAEIYDPGTNIWTTTGSMSTARHIHTATLLNDGRVLVTGGYASPSLATAEIFDPATGIWTATGSMNFARYYHTATLLPDGRVLVTGGYAPSVTAGAEIFDPATGVWTTTGSMNFARTSHTATLLSDGRVLVAGAYASAASATAEIFDPATGVWTTTGSMNFARYSHTATLLFDGRVFVYGSEQGASNLYTPPLP